MILSQMTPVHYHAPSILILKTTFFRDVKLCRHADTTNTSREPAVPYSFRAEEQASPKEKKHSLTGASVSHRATKQHLPQVSPEMHRHLLAAAVCVAAVMSQGRGILLSGSRTS
jgi:hypothetical protein